MKGFDNMICKDCGEKDMRYDEKEKSYHCNQYNDIFRVLFDIFHKKSKVLLLLQFFLLGF